MKKNFSTLLIISLLTALTFCSNAQDIARYQQPPAAIADLVLAPSTPGVNFDSKGRYALILERSEMPSIAELAEPELRIAGIRINPANFTQSRGSYYTGISLKDVGTGVLSNFKGLPANLRAGNIEWNPSETRFVFTHTGKNTVDLYMAEIATRQVKKINKTPLNLVTGAAISWLDDQSLIYKTITKPASAAPQKPAAPDGPVIQQNIGKASAARTFQDLIKNTYDESLFEFYATSKLVKNTNGVETAIGQPGIFSTTSLSPDKKNILIRRVNKPFSYLVPYNGFPSVVSITDLSGAEKKKLAVLPSSESSPTGFDNVQDIPRGFRWADDAAATIVWAEPLDSGKIKSTTPYHDAVYSLAAPFTGEKQLLFKTNMRYQNFQVSDGGFWLVNEGLNGKQKAKTSLYYPGKNTLVTLIERSTSDAYNNPGTPATMENNFGRDVVHVINDNTLLMRAQGASPKGDFPFLAKMNIDTKQSEKIWQCADNTYETVTNIIDWNNLTFITSKQSQTEAPNYFIRTAGKETAKQVTSFPDQQKGLQGISKQKVTYKRKDGIDLSGDLYLPKGYDAGRDGPLPVIIWAYPREFKSAADAAQVRGSQYTYTRSNYGSPIFWVTQGYAVLDNAEMPIVGEGEKQPNDNFIDQLKWNAEAAINYLAASGIGDRNRVAVGGHSYGAFMTANLLAHTNLFRAGIARSGAYNRSLTPFGFQNEERTYWQAPEVYHNMSPFDYADKIKTPLLMIHGEADNNQGTFPLQSERLFNAIKGHGGTVRFVLLPFEAHGYAAKENILHMLWEQHQWLEKYVKNVPKIVTMHLNAGNNDEKKQTVIDVINVADNDLIKTIPLYIVDGKEMSREEFEKVSEKNIQSINIVKDDVAIKKYGDKGRNGVLEITMKKQ
jgi:dipeptidyl aminopeptidase/acylaminoacyl peptidase